MQQVPEESSEVCPPSLQGERRQEKEEAQEETKAQEETQAQEEISRY
jgi:hypothetical protein